MMDEATTVVPETSTDGWSTEPINTLASFGAILGMIAAAVGLVLGMGNSLVPIPGIDRAYLHEFAYFIPAAIFLGLIAVSLILQIPGIRKLRNMLASNLPTAIYGAIIFAIIGVVILIIGGLTFTLPGHIQPWTVDLMLYGSIFTVMWQILSFAYSDSLKTWQGFFAGLFNGLFIPLVAIGQVISPLLVFAGYGVLLVGQLFTFMLWRSPENQVRDFARTTDIGKFGYGMIGLATFLIGSFAFLWGPITVVQGVPMWNPWGTLASPTTYLTNPGLIYAFCAMLVLWIVSIPRLGAKEMKFDHVRNNIVSGAAKWFMIFFAAIGVYMAGQAGSEVAAVVDTYTLLLSMVTSAVLIMMGSLYVSKSDAITGLPLLWVGVAMLIHPFSLAVMVFIPWIMLLVTQALILLESKIRGFLSFSQGFLILITILVSSAIFILVLLGGFGSGPASLWPTNKWFNISLFGGIPIAVQAATILALPTLVLLIRNMSIAGFAHIQGYSGGMILGMSFIFALLVPLIAGSDTVTHQANIGAAVLLALYTISFVLVLSFNLNLAGDLELSGRDFEGAFIRMTTIAGMIIGAIVMMIVLGTFANFYTTPADIGTVITLLVTFVVSLEILLDIGWLLAGLRLGIFKEGFKFVSMEEALESAPAATVY